MCINNFLLMLFLNIFLLVKFYRALQGFKKKKFRTTSVYYFLESKIVSDKISTTVKIWKWSILVLCTAQKMCCFYFSENFILQIVAECLMLFNTLPVYCLFVFIAGLFILGRTGSSWLCVGLL